MIEEQRFALTIRTEVHAETHLLANLAEIARHLDAEGEQERALELVTCVLHHPATTQFFKERTKELYTKLVSKLPSVEVKRIEREAHSQTLEEVVVATQRWLRGEV